MHSENHPTGLGKLTATFSEGLNGVGGMCESLSVYPDYYCCFDAPCLDDAHCDLTACTDEHYGDCDGIDCQISDCVDEHCVDEHCSFACEPPLCGVEQSAANGEDCAVCLKTGRPRTTRTGCSFLSPISGCSSVTTTPTSTPVRTPQQEEGNENHCHWGDDCNFAFTSPSDLDEHLRTSHISFLQNESLQQQLDVHPQPITSQQKQHQHTSKPLLNQVNAPSSAASLPCLWNSCNVTTDELDALLYHVENDHIIAGATTGSTSLPCQWDHCTVTAGELDALLYHVKNDHMGFSAETTTIAPVSANATPALPIVNPGTGLQCDQNLNADTTVINPNLVDSHILPTLPPILAAPLHCEWDACDFMTLSSNSLVSHVVHDHIHTQQVQVKQEPNSHQNLQLHTHTVHHHDHVHRPQPPCHLYPDSKTAAHHKCLWASSDGRVCGQCFSSTQDLSEHIIAEHVGSRKQEYTCMWSGCERNTRPFQQRQKIIRHLQIHTHNRPFECSVCGRRFAEQLVLSQHMRVHSGEKPYDCKVCGKRFAASTALSVHLRTHTGEKPLKCKWPGCGKTFAESSNLAKHMRIHTADRRFKCTVDGCKKAFLRHDQLVRHLRTHGEACDRGWSGRPNVEVAPIKPESPGLHSILKLEQGKMPLALLDCTSAAHPGIL
ncbi:hypothetical protein V1509DRAFT_617265 [Lipomyces kononenkoae]